LEGAKEFVQITDAVENSLLTCLGRSERPIFDPAFDLCRLNLPLTSQTSDEAVLKIGKERICHLSIRIRHPIPFKGLDRRLICPGSEELGLHSQPIKRVSKEVRFSTEADQLDSGWRSSIRLLAARSEVQERLGGVLQERYRSFISVVNTGQLLMDLFHLCPPNR